MSLLDKLEQARGINKNVHFAKVSSVHYTYLVAFFTIVLVLSNITATKGVEIGGFILDGAFYLFPFAYITADVISEVYGFRAMVKAIWLGFAILIFSSICFYISICLPAADFYDSQAAFEMVLGAVPQITIASLTAYLMGEFLNSFILVKIKTHTGEQHLWVRLIGSSIVGELFDTFVFCFIASSAIGITEWFDLINYTLIGFIWKTSVEVIVMPITYLVINYVKKRELSYYIND